MIKTQEERILLPTSQTTLIDIHHPAFLEGYREGRRDAFQDPEILTDKLVVEQLEFIFGVDRDENGFDDGEITQEDQYFDLGRLFGKISVRLIPHQPHEEEPLAKQQEQFLTKVTRVYGEGQALSESIQRLWEEHDQLARMLDAEDFDQMLYRGRAKVF